MSSAQRELIVEFVIAQMVRTNERRINLMEVFNHLFTEENINLSHEEYKEFVEYFRNRGIKIAHSQMIDKIQNYASIISHYHMHLWINNTKIPLKTSDNPILTFNRFKGKNGKVYGIANDDIEIYAKLEGYNPTGSVKDRIALNLILQAESEGKLKNEKTIIEPTSGNTGVAFGNDRGGERV